MPRHVDDEQRRTCLRGSSRATGALLIGALAPLLCLCAAAHGQELSRKDRVAILYSNQVVFDRRGEPLVSVRLTEGQSEVTLRSKGRLVLLPGADDGSRVRPRGGSTWTITVDGARPGKVRYWVVAERLPAGDLEGAVRARNAWTERGHQVQLFEAGALIGLQGRTLDTRTLSVGLDPQKTEADAKAHAKSLAGRYPILGEVVDESMERPGGWLVATEKRTGLEVRARDLLWIAPEGDAAIEIPGLEWGHGTPKRGRQDRVYRGDVYVAVGNDAKLVVVNLLSAEKLLEGVVPSEIYPSAPEAALRTQAVAARGQLLAKVGTRHRSDPYLLCAETHCQVYTGGTRANPRTTKAVRATRGQLLFDDRGLVDTVYSSSCGGHTEAFHEMWGGHPNPTLPGLIDDPGESTDPVTDVAGFLANPPAAHCAFAAKLFRWTKTRTGAKVTKAVNKRARVGAVHTIRPTRRGRSGRALSVEYIGTKGRHVVKGSYINRTLLGRLRSGMWVVEREGGAAGKQPARWVFRGGGFGHGVGMCQHGAIGLAKAGKDHDAILRHYYVGSALRRAW